jgi:1,4-dihydroxy-2-naphthoate octaprenyltransferase
MYQAGNRSLKGHEVLVGNAPGIGLLDRIKGHFLIMRPIQLLWLDVFVGFASYAVIARSVPNLHFLLFILCSLLSDAGACTLNDIGDVESDRLSSESSRNFRPMVKGTVRRRAATIQAYLLFLAGLGLALYLDIFVFIFALALVVISHQYSIKPLKMNGRPVISQLFWVGFAVLYYCAVSAYLIRYADVSFGDVLNGLYFLSVMVLFLALAETLAKDLRDLENDRDSGKRTTTVFIGARWSAILSFGLSSAGLILWSFPYYGLYDTPYHLLIPIGLVVIGWITLSFLICRSISIRYSKKRARQLHIGYLLTLTFILALTYAGGVY